MNPYNYKHGLWRICALSILAWTLAIIFAEQDAFAQNSNSGNYAYRTQNCLAGFGGTASGARFNGGFSGFGPQQANCSASGAQCRNTSRPDTTMATLEQTLNSIDNQPGWYSAPQERSLPVRPPAANSRSSFPGGASGLLPGVSKQEMLRVFLEGGSPQMGPALMPGVPSALNSSANASTAYSNYQIAQNESTKARNEANAARYDKNKWNRKDAANRAEYAARNAEYAASRAESAAYSADSQARGYANLARQAANRARASANQARYNADTIN